MVSDETTNSNQTSLILSGPAKLVGLDNWDDFMWLFSLMHKKAGLWKDNMPTDNCPEYTIPENIAPQLWPVVRTASSAKEQWKMLLMKFSSPTAQSKLVSVNNLIRHVPTNDVSTALILHSKIKRALIAAFGESFSVADFADLYFKAAVPAMYYIVRAVEEAKTTFDFELFSTALLAGQARMHPIAKLVTESKVSCSHGLTEKCYQCQPCPKCSKLGLFYTWHAQDDCPPYNKPRRKIGVVTKFEDKAHEQKPKAKLTVAFTPDSGCSDHMTNNKELIELYNSSYNSVETADGSEMPCLGYGEIHIQTIQGPGKLGNVLHVPSLTTNLLSIRRLDERGLSSVFVNNSYFVLPSHLISNYINTIKDKVILQGNRLGIVSPTGSFPKIIEWIPILKNRTTSTVSLNLIPADAHNKLNLSRERLNSDHIPTNISGETLTNENSTNEIEDEYFSANESDDNQQNTFQSIFSELVQISDENSPHDPIISADVLTNQLNTPDELSLSNTFNFDRASINSGNIIASNASPRFSKYRAHRALGEVMQTIEPPRHYKHIAGRSDEDTWYAAADQEFDGLIERNFGTLVPRAAVPKDKKILSSGWVFVTKATGQAKARWVLRGDQQTELINTYAPVAENASFKVFCSIAAHEDLDVDVVDVVQAFFCADHPGEVYVYQPQGYISKGQEDHVYLLNKSVYGLKDAPLIWHKAFDSYLLQEGFTPSIADPCVYSLENKQGKILMLVHVDDMAIAGNNTIQIKRFKEKLDEQFGIKDLGPITKYTSYEVLRDRQKRTITLHQQKYINELLTLANMNDAIPISTLPVSINSLCKAQSPTNQIDKDQMFKVPYSEIVGGLLHIAGRTRPEKSHPVSVVARFNSNPGLAHWNAVKSILRYLKGTTNYDLVLGGREPLILIGHVDANYAQCVDSRRSTTGYSFKFGNSSIMSKSHTQKLVSLSSCEAEITAILGATTESIWLKRLINSLGYTHNGPVQLHEDNLGAISYAHSKESHGRLKHVNVHTKFVREQLIADEISLVFFPSVNNFADVLTKVLPIKAFQKHRAALGVQSFFDPV